jgi:hypothetical protein
MRCRGPPSPRHPACARPVVAEALERLVASGARGGMLHPSTGTRGAEPLSLQEGRCQCQWRRLGMRPLYTAAYSSSGMPRRGQGMTRASPEPLSITTSAVPAVSAQRPTTRTPRSSSEVCSRPRPGSGPRTRSCRSPRSPTTRYDLRLPGAGGTTVNGRELAPVPAATTASAADSSSVSPLAPAGGPQRKARTCQDPPHSSGRGRRQKHKINAGR